MVVKINDKYIFKCDFCDLKIKESPLTEDEAKRAYIDYGFYRKTFNCAFYDACRHCK